LAEVVVYVAEDLRFQLKMTGLDTVVLVVVVVAVVVLVVLVVVVVLLLLLLDIC
jgi:hypothetical protein